ncbi:MAG: DUF1738 domain-containing protein [Nitrospirae bacterium]|nr:DUF1738 domain-containing protein [Nitrospirota bacterium]
METKTASTKVDVYSRITNKIIADLEKGIRTWMKPWNADHAAGKITRPLRYNGLPYKGINILSLWSASIDKGYACPLWLTFKQALTLGGNVRKGEKGELIVFANRITLKETNGRDEEEVERNISYMKAYKVFNAEQCDNLPAHYYAKAASFTLTPLQRIETADWTKHDKRLSRHFGRLVHGDEGYAKEELVAELGAAFLCADLSITPEVMPDHAAYIASWLTALKNDKRLIFSAASYAQRAVDYLHGEQPVYYTNYVTGIDT